MLKISTDGRMAARDMRLVTGQPSADPSKLEHAADTIAVLHHRHRANTYVDAATGERSPLVGALQIVFCDLSTPASDRWNAYDELRGAARDARPAARVGEQQRPRVVRVGRVTIDREARTAHVGDRPLQLTRLEFDLLATLAGQPHKAFTRAEITREVWGYNPAAVGPSRTIDSTAHRLRKKLAWPSLRGR